MSPTAHFLRRGSLDVGECLKRSFLVRGEIGGRPHDDANELIPEAEDVFAEPEPEPQPAEEEEEYDPDLEFDRAMAMTDPSRELNFHPESPAGLPVVDDDDLVDPFAEPENPVRMPTGPVNTVPPEPGDVVLVRWCAHVQRHLLSGWAVRIRCTVEFAHRLPH